MATVYQRITLCDRVAIEPADALRVDGFADDTLVRSALERLAQAAAVEPRWRARIWKRIPVAGGLGGGSSDAATALRLANATLSVPLPAGRLEGLAAALGGIRRPRDLAMLPPNDLASSPVAEELRARGAFRADVSGAGPTVYGLFHHRSAAEAAVAALAVHGRRAWLAAPAWYV